MRNLMLLLVELCTIDSAWLLSKIYRHGVQKLVTNNIVKAALWATAAHSVSKKSAKGKKSERIVKLYEKKLDKRLRLLKTD